VTRTGIAPTADQAAELAAGTVEGPIVMVNLLKFSGEPQEYGRYQEAVTPLLAKAGAELVWIGLPQHLVIGDPDADAWDAVALVRYPSRQAFLDMVSSPDYLAASGHRDRGLADTVLICCTEAPQPPMAGGA
jgi:uncharacterized protein (DUF1330 family)